MGTKPSAAAADTKKGQAEPAAELDKQRGTKRHQDKQTDEQHDTDAHAASKKPRRGAAAAAAAAAGDQEPEQQAGSSKAAGKDKKRTRAGPSDAKAAPDEPAQEAEEGSKRQTRHKDTASGAAAAAGSSAGIPEGADLVGCAIKVWWADDKKFYPGTVTVRSSAASVYCYLCICLLFCPGHERGLCWGVC